MEQNKDQSGAAVRGEAVAMHEHIMDAVARGWCAPKNATKTMDSDLVHAIVDEVEALFVSARAADALDSQPTEPYPLLRAAFATAESGPDGYFVRFKFPTLSAMQDAHMEWYGVSSQPTDGGVRNG